MYTYVLSLTAVDRRSINRWPSIARVTQSSFSSLSKKKGLEKITYAREPTANFRSVNAYPAELLRVEVTLTTYVTFSLG